MRPDAGHDRRTYRLSFRSCLSALGAALVIAFAPGAIAEDDAARLERLRAEMGTLRERLDTDRERLGAARERAFEIEKTMRDATSRQAGLEQRIAQKSDRIAELRALRDATSRQLGHARERALENAAARYALGFQPKLKVLLHQEDARKLSRHLAYYDYVIGTYRADAERTAARVETLARTEAALKLETNTLRRLRHETARHLESLERLRTEHESLAAAIARRMEDDSARFEQLEVDAERLAALLEELSVAAAPSAPDEPPPDPSGAAPAEAPPFDSLKGQLEWPAGGRVLKAPGLAMRDGGARWAGVLIETPSGTEVRAVAAGTVVFADWFRNLGQLVIVDHGNGYMSLYGNNAALYRQAGDPVAAGEVIASVGEGAGDLPQGLYFELRAGGDPLDPRRWCVARR